MHVRECARGWEIYAAIVQRYLTQIDFDDEWFLTFDMNVERLELTAEGSNLPLVDGRDGGVFLFSAAAAAAAAGEAAGEAGFEATTLAWGAAVSLLEEASGG
jgi:hypothetical protein